MGFGCLASSTCSKNLTSGHNKLELISAQLVDCFACGRMFGIGLL